jgi:hypothetical protein
MLCTTKIIGRSFVAYFIVNVIGMCSIIYRTFSRASCKSKHMRLAALAMYLEEFKRDSNPNVITRAFRSARELENKSGHGGGLWLGI